MSFPTNIEGTWDYWEGGNIHPNAISRILCENWWEREHFPLEIGNKKQYICCAWYPTNKDDDRPDYLAHDLMELKKLLESHQVDIIAIEFMDN